MSCCGRWFPLCLWMLVRVICSLCCLFLLFAPIIVAVDEMRCLWVLRTEKVAIPAAMWRNYYCCRPAGGLSDAQFAIWRQPFCFGQVKCVIKWPPACRCVHVRACVFSRKDKLISWHWYCSDWLPFPLWLLSKPTIEGWNGDDSRPDEAASLR